MANGHPNKRSEPEKKEESKRKRHRRAQSVPFRQRLGKIFRIRPPVTPGKTPHAEPIGRQKPSGSKDKRPPTPRDAGAKKRTKSPRHPPINHRAKPPPPTVVKSDYRDEHLQNKDKGRHRRRVVDQRHRTNEKHVVPPPRHKVVKRDAPGHKPKPDHSDKLEIAKPKLPASALREPVIIYSSERESSAPTLTPWILFKSSTHHSRRNNTALSPGAIDRGKEEALEKLRVQIDRAARAVHNEAKRKRLEQRRFTLMMTRDNSCTAETSTTSAEI